MFCTHRAGEYEDLVNRVHQLSASLLREETQLKNIRPKQRSVGSVLDSQGPKHNSNNEKVKVISCFTK